MGGVSLPFLEVNYSYLKGKSEASCFCTLAILGRHNVGIANKAIDKGDQQLVDLMIFTLSSNREISKTETPPTVLYSSLSLRKTLKVIGPKRQAPSIL